MYKKAPIIIALLFMVFGVSYLISQRDSASPDTSSQTTKPKQSSAVPGRTLDLSGQQLTNIPEDVLTETDITVLNISNNQLTTLPAAIANLVNLEVLNVENNRITSFPAELSQLKNLRQLLANNNRMENVSNALYTMMQLQVLDISGNNIPSAQISELKAKLSNTQVKY